MKTPVEILVIDGLPSFPMSEAQRVAVSQIALDSLAHSMAYEVATRDIESFCNSVGGNLDGEEFWEIEPREDEVDDCIAQALRYLDARGLVVRHPHTENWIALRDESEAIR